MTQSHGMARRGRTALWAILLPLTACGAEPPTEPGRSVASVTVAPGTAETAALGTTTQFSATARDASGEPIHGVGVSWTSSATDVATVDGSGLATAKGNGSASIRASVQGVTGSATFTVSQEPHQLSRAGGNAQEGPVGQTLPDPLRVRVVDSRANPIAGLAVTWEVTEGDGSIVGTGTDATGTATAAWTLGPTAGPGTVRAGIGDVDVTFTATAVVNGAIRGTVTEHVATYLSPPRLAQAVAARLGPVEGSAARARGGVVSSAAAATVRAGPVRPSTVPGELLVRLRTDRIGMAAAGSAVLRSRAGAEQAAVRMRRAAALWQAEEPLEVAGASPVVATLRVRVPPGREEAVRQRLLRRPEVASVERNQLVWGTGRPAGAHRRATPARAGPAPGSAPILPSVERPGAALGPETTLRPGSASRPAFPFRPGAAHAPAGATSEPYFTRQAWHYDVIDAFRAWEVTRGSSDVVVAVVDDGIRFDHPDIAANLRSDGYDFVTRQVLSACTGGSFSTSMDGDGPDPDPTIPASLVYDPDLGCVVGEAVTGNHGLHVAGTIGARAANRSGGVGVAWEVGIRPVRALGSAGFGTWYDVAQAILYAAGLPADGGPAGIVQIAPRADIINLSLGGPADPVLQDAVEAATDAGSLIVAAAGNAGSSALQYPAAYPQVLSVSSVAPSLSLASYSSFGSTVDLAAPGGETQDGPDRGVWSLVWDFQNGLPAYDGWQGTSMATPHVSGVAALVLAANPGLGAAELRARLVDNAFDLGAPGPDDLYGAGLVQADASVRNGFGAPRATYVWAVDAQGVLRGPVQTTDGGTYEIAELEDGEYRVYAGQDRNGDGLTGFFGRLWGAFGGSTTPAPIVVAQSSTATASFDLGLPSESEPNGALPDADPLPLGGYAYGSIASDSDVDLYRLDLSAATTVVVETDALIGACGLVDQVDTFLRLRDGDGQQITVNDDVAQALSAHCSRIERTLEAGTYFVEVTGFGGDRGPYAVRVASGL